MREGKHDAEAVLVAELHAPDAFRKPGHFKFWIKGDSEQISGLHFWCPCGCGSLLGVEFAPNKWTWDGNMDRPTVQPSILRHGGCGWHGFLTNGVFLEC